MKNNDIIENGLNSLATGLMGVGCWGTPVNQTVASMLNIHYDLIFNNRIALNELYICHGLIQTIVDDPVDDGLKNFKVKSKILSNRKLENVEEFIREKQLIDLVKQTLKWSRLFGGAGLVLLTGQDPRDELDLTTLWRYPLDFYSADLWELNKAWYVYNIDFAKIDPNYGDFGNYDLSKTPYLFYGIPVNRSRVLEVKAKESPSLMRPRMRGWGMSVVERLIKSFNQYLKMHNVIYELLDEAKIDICSLDQFKASLLTEDGTRDIEKRIDLTLKLKNFLNVLVMDKEDEFDQKQINFSGLATILAEIRKSIAADLKMPVSKIFGTGSTGFNSGEEDLESYANMIENEVREPATRLLRSLYGVVTAYLFDGKIVTDWEIEFRPIRVTTSKELEIVKSRKLNRIILAVQNGLISQETARKLINSEKIFDEEIPEDEDIVLPVDEGNVDKSVGEELTKESKGLDLEKAMDEGKDIDRMNPRIT